MGLHHGLSSNSLGAGPGKANYGVFSISFLKAIQQRVAYFFV